MSVAESLGNVLATFVANVNDNPRIPNLIRGWEPNIVIESADSADLHTMIVRQCKVSELAEGEHASAHDIRIVADLDVLREVFAGRRNAASTFLSGDLSIFGSDKDQVKLDAIALLVWGM